MKFLDPRLDQTVAAFSGIQQFHHLTDGEVIVFLTTMLYANIQGAPERFQRELRGYVMEALRTNPIFLAQFCDVAVDWDPQPDRSPLS